MTKKCSVTVKWHWDGNTVAVGPVELKTVRRGIRFPRLVRCYSSRTSHTDNYTSSQSVYVNNGSSHRYPFFHLRAAKFPPNWEAIGSHACKTIVNVRHEDFIGLLYLLLRQWNTQSLSLSSTPRLQICSGELQITACSYFLLDLLSSVNNFRCWISKNAADK